MQGECQTTCHGTLAGLSVVRWTERGESHDKSHWNPAWDEFGSGGRVTVICLQNRTSSCLRWVQGPVESVET